MASFAAAAASAKYRARVDNTEDDDHEKDDLRKLAEMMKLIKMQQDVRYEELNERLSKQEKKQESLGEKFDEFERLLVKEKSEDEWSGTVELLKKEFEVVKTEMREIVKMNNNNTKVNAIRIQEGMKKNYNHKQQHSNSDSSVSLSERRRRLEEKYARLDDLNY